MSVIPELYGVMPRVCRKSCVHCKMSRASKHLNLAFSMSPKLLKLLFCTTSKANFATKDYLFLILLLGLLKIVSSENHLNHTSASIHLLNSQSPSIADEAKNHGFIDKTTTEINELAIARLPTEESAMKSSQIKCHRSYCQSTSGSKVNSAKAALHSKSKLKTKSNFALPNHYSAPIQLNHKGLIKDPTSKHHKSVQKVSTDGEHETVRQYLPKGPPPPIKPASLLAEVASTGALKPGSVLKRMHQLKMQHQLLELLQRAALGLHRIAHKKDKLELLKWATSQLAVKGGKSLKLYWLLILLNPKFLREIYSSPTLLVMLLHAAEQAHLAAPAKFWLRPVMKLIEQPSADKEDRIWWKRKRIYESLFGAGSSELEPSLQTAHFQRRGKKVPIIVPHLVKLIRNLAGVPAPKATFYKQPLELSARPSLIPNSPTGRQPGRTPAPPSVLPAAAFQQSASEWRWLREQHQAPVTGGAGFHASQLQEMADFSPVTNPFGELIWATPASGADDWLSPHFDKSQLLSQEEFNALDAATRQRLLAETSQRLDEYLWSNELIKQQTEFIESLARRQEQLGAPQQVAAGQYGPQRRGQVHFY